MACYNYYTNEFSPVRPSMTPPAIQQGQTTPMTMPGVVLPSGIPSGPSPTPLVPTVQMPTAQEIPPTLESPIYTPGFLRTQVGKKMRVEFLIGTTGPLVDRTGTLIAVGTSYILLEPIESDDVMLCDIYSIKFVTILH